MNSNCAPLGPAKAQSAEPENALQVCEQHLDLFAITARLLERLNHLCQRTGNVTRFLVDAARDPANRRLWTASRLEQAATAVEYAREVKQSRFPIVDQPACRGENLTRRTDVNVTLLVDPRDQNALLKFKNPEAPAVKREAEEEWGQ